MKWDKGKIIWVSVGIPILIGGVLMLIWSALTQHLGQGDRLRPSDASDSRLEDLEIGSEPPDFSVSDLEGRQIALSEFKHRKIVVLYFWATGCDLWHESNADHREDAPCIRGTHGGDSRRQRRR